MLQGKYLKYTEDITFEIFEKIVKKLEEVGWKHLVSDPVEKQFKEFIEKGYLIYCHPSPSNQYSFFGDNVIFNSDTQIQVSDIIGSQFEVGKWYEIVSPNFKPGEHISKFKKSTGTQFWFSECIHFGNYLKKEDWHGYPNSVRLCTLEEIQQYLPEGHQDKVSKSLTVDDLVEGEVYYHKCLQYSYIVKFKKLDGISITGEYYIDLETNNYYKNYRNTSITELRSATPSEKKWLLTCIKQDKFIKQSELDKYDDEGNLIEVKPTFKFDKWYKYPNKKTLIFIKENLKDCYGFTAQGWWKNNWDMSDILLGDYILATSEEVSERLISYAKEKYSKNDSYRCLLHKDLCSIRLDDLQFTENLNRVVDSDIGYIFYDGHWAEIVSKPKSKTTEVNRNVYYEVSNQEQYNEILDWLVEQGESLSDAARALSVYGNWNYICYYIGGWILEDVKPNRPKAEFKFKNNPGIREQILNCTDYAITDLNIPDIFYKPCTEQECYKSHRTIPQIEKVTNRFKTSPVRKRSLPEIY